MKKMFYGLLFVLFSFTLSLGSLRLEIFPDFVGFILLALGMGEMAPRSGQLARAIPFAWGMAVYTAVLYVLKMLSVPVQLDILFWLLGAVALAVSLWIRYRIVRGILELEEKWERSLQGEHLKMLWQFEAALSGVCYLLNWIPMVSAIAMIAAAIVSVCFLVGFYRSWKLLETDPLG